MSADSDMEKEQLSRERIVETALALVDAEGIDALSMRRLGAELGVDPMAIYYYVPNKATLLDAIVEAVMSEIDLSCPSPEPPPPELLMIAARAYAAAMLAHVNALPIVLSRAPSTQVAMKPVEVMVGILRDGGLSIQEAVAGMNVVAAAVRGYIAMIAAAPEEWTQRELLGTLSPDEFPNLHEATTQAPQDPEAQFEFGLNAIVRGLLGE